MQETQIVESNGKNKTVVTNRFITDTDNNESFTTRAHFRVWIPDPTSGGGMGNRIVYGDMAMLPKLFTALGLVFRIENIIDFGDYEDIADLANVAETTFLQANFLQTKLNSIKNEVIDFIEGNMQ